MTTPKVDNSARVMPSQLMFVHSLGYVCHTHFKIENYGQVWFCRLKFDRVMCKTQSYYVTRWELGCFNNFPFHQTRKIRSNIIINLN